MIQARNQKRTMVRVVSRLRVVYAYAWRSNKQLQDEARTRSRRALIKDKGGRRAYLHIIQNLGSPDRAVARCDAVWLEPIIDSPPRLPRGLAWPMLYAPDR
jgi:hypothetical protein